MLDNYPMDEEIYDKRFFMKEALLLAVPASFESNKAAGAWGMTSEDIRQNVHLSLKSMALRSNCLRTIHF